MTISPTTISNGSNALFSKGNTIFDKFVNLFQAISSKPKEIAREARDDNSKPKRIEMGVRDGNPEAYFKIVESFDKTPGVSYEDRNMLENRNSIPPVGKKDIIDTYDSKSKGNPDYVMKLNEYLEAVKDLPRFVEFEVKD